MNRKLTLYIALIVIILGLFIYSESSKPKPVNWTPSYSVNDKIPLGLFVFNKETPTLFKGDAIERFWKTPYEYFDEKYDYDTDRYRVSGSFIAIDEYNDIDEQSVNELLNFADYGNTIFLSMQSFPQAILDTLGLQINRVHVLPDNDSIQVSTLKSPSKKYWFKEGASFTYFDSIVPDSIKSGYIKILGNQEKSGKKQPNFIQVPFGSGRIVLHTNPAAFTNYYLLNGKHYEYAQKVASQLPKGSIYWQSSYGGEGVSDSPLRYILSQPALRWAFWLSLAGMLVFIFFNARRKQRTIPIIEPVRNSTVDFARTIGNLYFMEGNHHTIIEKKIIYFLEHVRTEYLIDTFTLDDAFAEKLHLKTGKPINDIKEALHLIKKHRHNFNSTEADVAAINNAIENLRL